MSGGRNRQAGGVVLAAGILGGAIVGAILHQASIGFLAGLGVGSLAAVLIWLLDRR